MERCMNLETPFLPKWKKKDASWPWELRSMCGVPKWKKPHNQKPDDPENLEEEASIEEGNLPEIPEEDEDPPSREELEEEYRQLGGRPQADWPLEKLMTMLEERRGE